MKVLMYPTMPAAVKRYRFERPMSHMSGNGTEFVDFNEFAYSGDMMRDIRAFIRRFGSEWDVMWTNNYSPEGQSFVELLQENGTKIVADVDDWFEDVPAGNVVVEHWQGRRKKWYDDLLTSADSVTCSTRKLHDTYGGTLAPNFVDLSEWDHKRRPASDYTLIGCCSGVGRAGDFLMAEKALKNALKLDHVKVIFVGHMPQWALAYQVGKVVWSRWSPIDVYPKLLRWISPDIMISPMEHVAFNEAKSNLKWLESGAIGSCFLGERWGEYARTVDDGTDGVLASGQDEWAEKLKWLCEDKAARERIAQQGSESIRSQWTWDSVGDAWREGVLVNGEVASKEGNQLSTRAVG